MIVEALLSAVVNVVLLAGIPFACYAAYHRLRHKRSYSGIAQRAGLRIGDRRYIGYCLIFGLLGTVILIVWPPSLEASVAEGSSFKAFEGLGLGATSVFMALLYGVVKTGFAEEFLFRGLIAGSLSRRTSVMWANVIQALIFLAPHLLLLKIAPEMWPLMPLIFVGSLFIGWARIKSGSIVGPWLVHAMLNIATGLSVAIRSTP